MALSLAMAMAMFAGLGLAPGEAHASCRPSPSAVISHRVDADAPYQDCLFRERTGVETSFHLGFGSSTNPGAQVFFAPTDSASTASGARRAGPGVAANVSLGWRILPTFSAGLHLFYEWAPGTSLPGVRVGQSDFLMTGVYGRFYLGSALGIRRIEPWIGLGFDHGAPAWVTNTTGTLVANVSFAAVAIPIDVGIDYNVSPLWSVGLLVRLTPWIPYQRCPPPSVSPNGVATSTCSGADLSPVPFLFVGLGTRFLSPV